jgi:hypothetical protein
LQCKKKGLNKNNPKLTLNRNPHTCITPFISKLVLPMKTHLVMAIEIALGNSQNPHDWFKTHWMNIEIIISSISMAQPMFKE